MPFLVEGHRQVVVLRHKRSLENPVNSLNPVSSLLLSLCGELICPVRCVHDEAEALLSEAWAKTRNHQVAGAGVTKEYLTLKQEIKTCTYLTRQSLTLA